MSTDFSISEDDITITSDFLSNVIDRVYDRLEKIIVEGVEEGFTYVDVVYDWESNSVRIHKSNIEEPMYHGEHRYERYELDGAETITLDEVEEMDDEDRVAVFDRETGHSNIVWSRTAQNFNDENTVFIVTEDMR